MDLDRVRFTSREYRRECLSAKICRRQLGAQASTERSANSRQPPRLNLQANLDTERLRRSFVPHSFQILRSHCIQIRVCTSVTRRNPFTMSAGVPKTFWSSPIRYLRWASHEKPAIFWSIIVGSLGPVSLFVIPRLRKMVGDEDPPKIPLTYPSE